MAKSWIEKEMAWYTGNATLGLNSRYQPVDNAGMEIVGKDQLEKAKSEY